MIVVLIIVYFWVIKDVVEIFFVVLICECCIEDVEIILEEMVIKSYCFFYENNEIKCEDCLLKVLYGDV